MLQVDPGREFMGAVTKEMEKHKNFYQAWPPLKYIETKLSLKRFNRTLAERFVRVSVRG